MRGGGGVGGGGDDSKIDKGLRAYFGGKTWGIHWEVTNWAIPKRIRIFGTLKEIGRGARGIVPTAHLWGLSSLHSRRSRLREPARTGDSPVEGRGSRGRIHLSAIFQTRSSTVKEEPGTAAPPPG